MGSCAALIPRSSLSRRLLVGLPTAWLLLVGSAAFAETRFVATSGNDSGNTCLSSGAPCKTITHALTQAVAGDTISVAAGTYNLALGEIFPLTIATDLTLTGAGAWSTILDATGANTRVITIGSESVPVPQLITVTIAGVTITGGAVSCIASENGCQPFGGGLENFGTLTLTNSSVSGNAVSCGGSFSCGAGGGGLFNEGVATLTNSTVSGNTVGCTSSTGFCTARGGGIDGFGATPIPTALTLTNSTVSGNTVSCTNCFSVEGGGLHNIGTAVLTNSTVSENTVSCTNCSRAEGGGISGAVTLTNSSVSGNTVSCTKNNNTSGVCDAEGGGISHIGPLTLTNSTVSGNTVSCTSSGTNAAFCDASGGGLENLGTLTLTNSSVSGNAVSCTHGPDNGCFADVGGLFNTNLGIATLLNTIIAKQLAGSDCVNAGTLISNGFNLDSDNTCQLTQPSDHPGMTNPLLGPLANNGGPTQTHALLPGSPAIDAGTNTGCPSTDQRGVTRPQGAACDIGAFEFGVNVAGVLLNRSAFRTGEQITYQATLFPGAEPPNVDIYLGVLLPDGVTFVSFVPGPGETIVFAFGLVPVPFAENVTLAPMAVPFSYTFAGTEPVGTYFTYAGLAVADSNPLQAENQLSVGVQAFQFTP
ncbi:MAG: DUF1565 domain-containing protein [Candidatus Methylomirabilis oxyfera]|nr:DUF1565 domain-containing protein [Candidatus Methylomirabilis oxyfera]